MRIRRPGPAPRSLSALNSFALPMTPLQANPAQGGSLRQGPAFPLHRHSSPLITWNPTRSFHGFATTSSGRPYRLVTLGLKAMGRTKGPSVRDHICTVAARAEAENQRCSWSTSSKVRYKWLLRQGRLHSLATRRSSPRMANGKSTGMIHCLDLEECSRSNAR